MLEKRNYQYNKKVHVRDGFINGQALVNEGRMHFGVRNLAVCGSCVIAVYNLLLILNRRAPLEDVTREVYIRARTPLGIFGAGPFRLVRCFSAHYLPVNLERDFKKFCSKMQPGFSGIIIWWTGRRFFSKIHAAAVDNDKGKIMVYNRLSKSTMHYEFKSMEQITEAKKFIIGYYINTNEFYK